MGLWYGPSLEKGMWWHLENLPHIKNIVEGDTFSFPVSVWVESV